MVNLAQPQLYIHGLGIFHPENEIDNHFLESLDIGTNHEWIMDRVGIKSRRTVLPLDYIRETKNHNPRGAIEAALYSNAETGQRAAEAALKMAGINADQIGMVIAGGCSPDMSIPAEASTIAAKLNIEAPAFDLHSACSTFGTHIHFLAMMQPEQLPDYILLVLPENTTRVIDFSDRSAAVLWGDGTQATIVSTKIPSSASISFTSLNSNPASWKKVVIPRYGHFAQEGRAVQTFAIKRTVQCYRELLKITEEKPQGKLYFIGHQANLTMLESVCKRCDIAPEQHLYNIDHYGNTGAAGAPSVLTQNWERFESGDTVAMVVVGAGLTWSSMMINFS